MDVSRIFRDESTNDGVFCFSGVQLIHNSAHAASSDDADDGLIFIQEMVDLMKNSDGTLSSEVNSHLPLSIIPLSLTTGKSARLIVGPAQFGRQMHGELGVKTSKTKRISLIIFRLDFCSIKCWSTVFCLFTFVVTESIEFSFWNCSSRRLYVH